ncbi:MAG TPA: hypothetical protein VKS82_22260, partial [Streptosporangiaceae bacterium]|nr:hypothetical protein [Streptosporangiaceae bacterium]
RPGPPDQTLDQGSRVRHPEAVVILGGALLQVRPELKIAHRRPSSHGGRNPDRHPRMADETRIDTIGWRTKPGSTTMEDGLAVRS